MTDASTPKPASLPDLGPAPELTNETWLNVDSPVRLADLRGKVVIVEMWTFGCINCQHVIPSLKEWHSKYKDQGLVIIGNHYPEFSYEADLDTLKDAIARYEIQYAVTQDNDGATWRAYKNHYWPTLYLIDKQRTHPLCAYRRRKISGDRRKYQGIIGRIMSLRGRSS